MFYPFRLYFKDRWISLPFLVISLIQLFSWWYTVSKISPTEEQLFLHYNIIFGVDLIGEWWRIWLIPAGGLLLWLINYSISYIFYKRNVFISRLLASVTALFEVLILIGTILVVGLNI